MKGQRLWQTVRLASILSASRRAEYLKKHHVFSHIGNGCSFMPRIVPLYPSLIRMGDNVRIASKVTFITHDFIHLNLNYYAASLPPEKQCHFHEGLGCIEIGNNVFVGAGCYIFYDVKIGDNVIVISGSVVTNDVPSNTVVRGNPAKKVCSFDDYYKMKAAKAGCASDVRLEAETVSQDIASVMWEDFYKRREK